MVNITLELLTKRLSAKSHHLVMIHSSIHLVVRFDSIKSEGRVVAADQFFLSHCHTDHMVGIDTLAMFLRFPSYIARGWAFYARITMIVKTMYDWFAREENGYEDRADMFQFRLDHNVPWLNFQSLLHSITLLLVSGRRPMAQKSITSSIVQKYPRLVLKLQLDK